MSHHQGLRWDPLHMQKFYNVKFFGKKKFMVDSTLSQKGYRMREVAFFGPGAAPRGSAVI